MANCKLCGNATNVIVNIHFKAVPVCDYCCNTIMLQTAKWHVDKFTEANNSKILLESITSFMIENAGSLRVSKIARRGGRNLLFIKNRVSYILYVEEKDNEPTPALTLYSDSRDRLIDSGIDSLHAFEKLLKKLK